MGFILLLLIAWPILGYLSLRAEGRKFTGDPEYNPTIGSVAIYIISSYAAAVAINDVTKHHKNTRRVK